MDARQLAYFLSIVDYGSFRRASEGLHVAQPSLSQSMSTLERELGVKLFHRAGRGVTLSEPGRRLVGPARQVVRSLQNAREAVTSTRDLLTGTVELVAMPSPSVEPLTTLISCFRNRHPRLSMDVRAAFTAKETIEAIRSGIVEIGLVGTSVDFHFSDLEYLELEQQSLVLVSPPGDPGLPSVQREELRKLNFVISQRGSLMREFVDDVLADPASSGVIVEVAHRTSLLALIHAGIGHSVMPEAWRTLAEGLGCNVRMIEPRKHLNVALVYPRGVLAPAAQAFVDLAQEHVQLQSRPWEQPAGVPSRH